MKTNINKLTLSFALILLEILFSSKINSQFQWDQNPISQNGNVVDVKFINSNTGFLALRQTGSNIKIYKTTDKGVNFQELWQGQTNEPTFSIAFINSNTGFVFYNNSIHKLVNGIDLGIVKTYNGNSRNYKIKFFQNGTGYSLFSNKTGSEPRVIVNKTTDYGETWYSVYNTVFSGNSVSLNDIDVNKSNPSQITVVGYIYQTTDTLNKKGLYIRTDNSFQYTPHTFVGNHIDTLSFDYVNFLPNNDQNFSKQGNL